MLLRKGAMASAKSDGRQSQKAVSILGCRGIPSKYGGFETFAERLALYLARRGWSVTVYCQGDRYQFISEEYWNNIRLIHVPVPGSGGKSSVLFDWKSTCHAADRPGLVLTLGYNTAIFCFLYWLKDKTNLINMDGLEWRRQKWNFLQKAWLYTNERFGCWLATHLIADHPEIATHLATRVSRNKITMIPYGAESSGAANPGLLKAYGLSPYSYATVIARSEPENHILEIVSAFSSKRRGYKLVVLGKYFHDVAYHQQVMKAASDEVIFPGAIYDRAIVYTLRFYTRLYVHGHQVGGTNPSLVEALGASSPILAHDNQFNRWVAGVGAHYFKDAAACRQKFDELLEDDSQLHRMRMASRQRYQEEFANNVDLRAYETLLEKFIYPSRVPASLVDQT